MSSSSRTNGWLSPVAADDDDDDDSDTVMLARVPEYPFARLVLHYITCFFVVLVDGVLVVLHDGWR